MHHLKNIVQLSKADRRGGGASAVAEDLHKQLLSHGYFSSHWMGWRGDGEQTGQFLVYNNALGAAMRVARRALEFTGYPDYYPVEAKRFVRLIKQSAADLVHAHDISGLCAPATLRAIAKHRPVIWTLHDFSAFTGGCINPLDCDRFRNKCGPCPQLGRWPLRTRFDKTEKLHASRRSHLESGAFTLVCPSNYLAMEVGRTCSLKQPAKVIPNGVDTRVFRPQDRRVLRSRLKLPLDRPLVLLATGDLDNPFKGYYQLFQRLRAKGLNCAFLAIGDTASSDPGRESNFDFEIYKTGYIASRSVLADYFAAADVFLYPTLADSFGLVVIEAMAAGTPVAAFSTGGVPELIVHNETGLLAPRGDYDALLEQLSIGLNSGALPAWGRNARLRVETSFSSDAFFQRHVELYHEILEKWASRGVAPS